MPFSASQKSNPFPKIPLEPQKLVLLVDDSKTVRLWFRHMIEGYSVVDVTTIREAKRIFLFTKNLAAIICDHYLDGENGLDLYNWIRQRSSIPFILLSGSLPEGVPPNLPTLAKTYAPSQLRDMLGTIIAQHEFAAP